MRVSLGRTAIREGSSMTGEYCSVTDHAGGVATLTITQAGRANALGTPVMSALIAALTELARRDELRAVILTGSGERSFTAGADLNEMAQLDQESAQRFISRLRDLCEAVRTLPVPVVARIGGWCLGGGLELAMACDLRIAVERAKFAMPEVKVGVPSVIHAALMPRLIGAGRARRMILTGETIDAATALHWGLIDRMAADDALDAAMAEMLAPILSCEPQVIRAQKALLRQWDELPLSAAVEASVQTFGQAFTTGEPQRAMRTVLDNMRARAEKRG
jgi:enoyl-CoA hydratase